MLLTEDYTVEVVLPLGATNIKVDMPFEAEVTTDGVNFGTLDYFGAPVITIKSSNANNLVDSGDITITYTYSPAMLIMKPLYLSSIVFAFLVVMIASFRVSLSLKDDQEKQKQD